MKFSSFNIKNKQKRKKQNSIDRKSKFHFKNSKKITQDFFKSTSVKTYKKKTNLKNEYQDKLRLYILEEKILNP